MSKKRIAVIAGDGIGKEVMPEGMRVVDAAARKFGIDLPSTSSIFPAGTTARSTARPAGRLEGPDRRPRRHLLRRGRLAREDPRPRVAVGLAAAVPPRVRPVRQPAPGAPDARHHRARGAPRRQPRQPGEIDMYIVRENTEGEYSSIGGRMYPGTEREIVMQET
jgi:tartrate dehydrogenase/decarboxylase/D-malate dehydrogenase